MTITINRKRVEISKVFSSVGDFVDYLKENYNKLNFDNPKIKSSIEEIYQKMINGDGNLKRDRLTRWLPKQFGFKYRNILQKGFWLERGFDEDYYKSFIKSENDRRGKSITKTNNKKRIEKSKLIVDGLTKFKSKYIYFEVDYEPICKACNSKLNFLKRKNKDEGDYYDILGCKNKKCETNNKEQGNKLIWESFLPSNVYEDLLDGFRERWKENSHLSIDHYLSRRYSKEEAISIISELQSEYSKMVKNRFVCSKENLRNRGYTEEEIYNICQTPVMADFWLKKGYTEEESEKLIRENQKYASQFVDFDNRLLPSNKEYWIKRGYSEKDSIVKVSNSQRTFSKDICIEKYGKEKGLEVFNKRQIKWRESLNKGGNLKIGYSKISQELFDILNEMVVDNKHFQYATNGGEYKISRKEGGVWMYDFVCLDRNKIIEYQGDMYHANPKIYEEHEYPHPFRKNKTSKEIWGHDKKKKMRANEEGFEVLYIWDSEFRRVSSDRKKKIIQKCINFLSK